MFAIEYHVMGHVWSYHRTDDNPYVPAGYRSPEDAISQIEEIAEYHYQMDGAQAARVVRTTQHLLDLHAGTRHEMVEVLRTVCRKPDGSWR